MAVTVNDYVSIIATNYLQPLATLIERLVANDREGLPGIKSNEHEVGWSVSTILLAVVMFESWLGWTRLHKAHGTQQFQALAFYDELRAAHQALPDMTEVFVMRDVIAHNHIWNVQFEWDETEHRLLGLNQVAGGDRKFRNVVDSATGISRTLGLHLVPTLVDRSDVKKVLDQIIGAMTALCAADLLLPQALKGNAIIGTKGQRVTLFEIAALF